METRTVSERMTGEPRIGARLLWTARIANVAAVAGIMFSMPSYQSAYWWLNLISPRPLIYIPNLAIVLCLLKNPPAKKWVTLSFGVAMAWLPIILHLYPTDPIFAFLGWVVGVPEAIVATGALLIHAKLGSGLAHWLKLLTVSMVEAFLLAEWFSFALFGGYERSISETLLDWAVTFMPAVVSVVGLLVSLMLPHSRRHRALLILLVAFGIAVSGLTLFRWYLEQRGCANAFLSAGIHISIKPPQPMDWAVVFLPTLLSAAGVFVSLRAPHSKHHRALRISLVVLGIAVCAATFFWQQTIGLVTPCFLGG